MTETVTATVSPVACPDCQTDQIKGPDQPAAGLSYWRCLKCGLVWNPDRPPARGQARRAERAISRNRSSDYWHNK